MPTHSPRTYITAVQYIDRTKTAENGSRVLKPLLENKI